MQEKGSSNNLSFFGRLGLALKFLFNAEFARELMGKAERPEPAPAPALPPERVHASGLSLLAALQREGRLVDFLQQEVAGFSDEEVGAAARVVHVGCGKAVRQYLDVEPVSNQAEGSTITLPAGFDAQRFRVTGNVTGKPPFRGTLKHHGWVVKELRFPDVSGAVDPRVLAPAEVELA